jgi:hypothetical protein
VDTRRGTLSVQQQRHNRVLNALIEPAKRAGLVAGQLGVPVQQLAPVGGGGEPISAADRSIAAASTSSSSAMATA